MLATIIAITAAGSYPLMDGQCLEYEDLNAQQIELTPDAVLYLFQDDSYVWICHTVPSRAMSWDDLELISPAFPDGINLHASAQLGEWPLNDPEAQPQSSSSELWWRIDGWWANTAGPNGMVEVNGRRQTKWTALKAREYQLSKERFGRGEWKIRFNLHMAIEGNGDGGGLVYPDKSKAPMSLHAK